MGMNTVLMASRSFAVLCLMKSILGMGLSQPVAAITEYKEQKKSTTSGIDVQSRQLFISEIISVSPIP
jgi:hypothetical protein